MVSSQTDWYNPEDYTFERLRSIIGHKVVRDGDGEECSEEEKREGVSCHSIKEVDPRLMGKEWASMRASNLTAIGVETYDDFMQVQVRLGSWKMLLFIGGGGAGNHRTSLHNVTTRQVGPFCHRNVWLSFVPPPGSLFSLSGHCRSDYAVSFC
jgi:hypothetical protein